MCCLFEASLYSFRRVLEVACISNEARLSVAPESVAEAYLIGLSSRSSPAVSSLGNQTLSAIHNSRRRLGSGPGPQRPWPDWAAPGFSFSYVTMYNSSKAILELKQLIADFHQGQLRTQVWREHVGGLYLWDGFFRFVCSRGRWSTPQTHKAVNWRLFHVSCLVLEVRNLLEFSVK